MLGVDLGPEEGMLSADDGNPAGYWELTAINDLNDEILAALGGSLWDPPSASAGWEDRPEMGEFRERAADTAAALFAGDRRWGFKDTRTLHTMPLWRRVIGPMDYVICVRHPVEVVRSLGTMLPDRTENELYGRWVHGNCLALRGTSGERRTFVFYDDWSVDPIGVAGRLNAFLEGHDAALDEDVQAEIRAFFDGSLHRRRADPTALGSPDVPVEAAALHLLLRALAAGEASGAPEATALQAVASRLDSGVSLESALAAERQESLSERRALDSRLDQLERERTALLADREWLREQLAQVQSSHDAAVAALNRAWEEIASLTAQTERAHAALSVVEDSRSWRLTAPLRAAKRRLGRG